MALVDSFPSEPGRGRCGDSFASGLTVRGTLPRRGGFGSDLSYEIPAYIAFSKTEDAVNDPQALAEVRDVIESVRSRLADEKVEHRQWMTQPEQRSLTKLLQRADLLSTDSQKIWDRWSMRPWGTWPLWLGDSLGSIPLMICDRQGARIGWHIIDVRQWLDGEYETTGQEESWCPLQEEVYRRPVDRALLIENLQEALRSLRCADYHLHRTRLYREAKQRWEDLPGRPRPDGPGGFRATPEGEPEGPFLQAPTEIPDTPEGEEIPDPDDLPTVEGEGVVVEPDRPGLTVPDTLKKRAPQLLIAGGGVLVATGAIFALLGR